MLRRSYTIGPKRRMPRANATYVASAERRHRLDRPKGGVEDDCGLGMGQTPAQEPKEQVSDIRED
jgi:hypothetical protein